MRAVPLVLAMIAAMSASPVSYAGEEGNADDFMQLHKVEIAFHEAGSTKDLVLMLSLFADDAVLTAKSKTADGKEQTRPLQELRR